MGLWITIVMFFVLTLYLDVWWSNRSKNSIEDKSDNEDEVKTKGSLTTKRLTENEENEEPQVDPGFKEIFYLESERIKFLNSFLEWYNDDSRYDMEGNPLTNHNNMRTYTVYCSNYKFMMRIYFSNHMKMIDDIKKTDYYNKLEDKVGFQKEHREFGNEIIEEDEEREIWGY